MDKASEALSALNPVTFRYKKEIDPASAFRSLASWLRRLKRVSPDLVARDQARKTLHRALRRR